MLYAIRDARRDGRVRARARLALDDGAGRDRGRGRAAAAAPVRVLWIGIFLGLLIVGAAAVNAVWTLLFPLTMVTAAFAPDRDDARSGWGRSPSGTRCRRRSTRRASCSATPAPAAGRSSRTTRSAWRSSGRSPSWRSSCRCRFGGTGGSAGSRAAGDPGATATGTATGPLGRGRGRGSAAADDPVRPAMASGAECRGWVRHPPPGAVLSPRPADYPLTYRWSWHCPGASRRPPARPAGDRIRAVTAGAERRSDDGASPSAAASAR